MRDRPRRHPLAVEQRERGGQGSLRARRGRRALDDGAPGEQQRE
ncbi:hypothetical protein [uncultured Sphingomonas sp.]